MVYICITCAKLYFWIFEPFGANLSGMVGLESECVVLQIEQCYGCRLDSDAEEPATDYKKEELLRLRNGRLLFDYVYSQK